MELYKSIDLLNPKIYNRKVRISDLGTLEFDTLNSERLIFISNVDTFNFLLNPLFFISLQDSRVLSLVCAQNLKLLACDQLFQISHTPLNWLNFTCFSEYKLQIKTVLRIIKRGDQALISISTILKFSALND